MARKLLRAVAVTAMGVAALVSIRAQSVRTRTVSVSVVDKSGAAVPDLTKEDFSLKEKGTPRDILAVRTLPTRFRLAIIDSDGGSGMYQAAIGTFVRNLFMNADPLSEVSLTSVVGLPQVLLDYEVEPEKIVAGINKLGQRAGDTRRPGQLIEAIGGALKTVVRPGYRPVVLVFRVGGESASNDTAQPLRDAMLKNGVALFVVAPSGASDSGGGVDASMQLQLVIQDGSKESGGRYISANGNGAVKAMEQLATELLNTYEITYTLPEDVAPSDAVSVAVGRKDVKVASQSRVR
jgi:hypothetical protein